MNNFYILLFCLLCIPPSSAQEPSDTTIYTIVEEMPFLKSCEDSSETHREKRLCSDKKLLEYVYKNLRLPQINIEYIESTLLVVSFVINQDGKVQDVEIMKSIQKNIDDQVVKMIKDLPEWIPGRQRGKNVSVRFKMPMRINLH